ncbi:sensor histidine kinase [Amycolatopsis benzoatilytica]|uniref:sensor histidine kinase n=1 Tax=Amycolatopsis benzoatilytica TaxID=346045 RepID=UPI00035D56CF|nr:ATP-binding protein [Amycolatopsis benzoatilytica]
MSDLGCAGDRLVAVTPEVVERYRRTLVRVRNPLGTTPELWAESRTHATLILEGIARVLDRPLDAVTDRNLEEDLLSASVVGGLWACCKARLTDSLAAIEILQRHALDAVAGFAAELPPGEAVLVVTRAARVIGRLGSLHAQTAAMSYDAFLLQQIEQVNSDGRVQLARDLHDRLGNSLVLGFRHLELFRAKAVVDDPAVLRHLDQVQESLDEATAFTRRVVSGLRAEAPLTSLAEALAGCAADLNFRDVPVRIAVHGDEAWLPDYHRDELFLIVREFLRNAFGHAAPDSVSVRVRISPGRVDLEAFDDGRGFVFDERRWAAESPASRGSGGSGLSIMRERTEQLGGELSLSTRLGKGTRIRLWVPLPQAGGRSVAVVPRAPAPAGRPVGTKEAS